MDQASLAAISQQLSPRQDISQEVGQGHAVGKPKGLGIFPQALSSMKGPQPCCSLMQYPLFAQALHNQMITAVQEISNLIEPVAAAARAEASQLGHKVMGVWHLVPGEERYNAAGAGSCWC